VARLRVLVTGAGGMLGGRLASLLAATHDVIAMRHEAAVPEGLDTVPGDLLDPASLARAIDSARADAVVHAAALADADRCESDPVLARRANVEATAAIARRCHDKGARLIALSTDLVLGGDRAWTAEDVPARPVLVYGRTKLEAEEAVLAEASDATVVRVALVLGRGFGPRSTASEGIGLAITAGQRLRLFTDQFRTPVDPESVAEALRRLLDRPLPGRLHLGGPERLDRHELGLRVARVLSLPTEGIEATREADSPAPRAKRPSDVSLDWSRARRELGWAPRALDDAIRESRR